MNLVRIGILVGALAIAGVVAFLVNEFIQGSAPEPQVQLPQITTSKVLVANKNLPAGTVLIGGEIGSEDDHLRWQAWPEDAIDPSWMKIVQGEDGAEKRKQFIGAAVKRGLVAGEPITPARVVMKGEKGFMAGALAPGMRAVSIPISQASAVSGFIVPGSHVDMILTKRFQETEGVTGTVKSRFVSETILRDIVVIAIDQKLDDLNQNALVGKTATVEVTPKQAEQIAVAKAMGGNLSLALRSLTTAEQAQAADPFTSELEVSKFLSRDPGIRRPVLVASHELKAGMLLTDADVSWRTVPPDFPTEGLFVKGRFNEADLRGALLRADLQEGEAIEQGQITSPASQGFLTAALGPGMRAISVAVTDVSGVSGYVSPGDRVDVVLTHLLNDRSPNAPMPTRKFSESILRNVRILAIEQTVDESSGKPVIGGTATLELTPKQAEVAFLASTMGSLSLALVGDKPGRRRAAGDHFTSDLEVSRAAWELIRGFNRFGPKVAPQPEPEHVVKVPDDHVVIEVPDEPVVVEVPEERPRVAPPGAPRAAPLAGPLAAPPPPPVAAPVAPPPAPPVVVSQPRSSRVKVKIYRAVGVSGLSVSN